MARAGGKTRREVSLDTSTLDAPHRRARAALSPTVRVVFRADLGVVNEAPRPLAKDETWIGRGVGEGDLSLEDDGLASRQHACVRKEGGRISIEDNASRNGVFVRGAKVARAILDDGDVVRIGGSFLVVRFEPKKPIDAANELLVGAAPAMRLLRTSIARVAPSQASVLVTGESGTGKELVARSLHDSSGRSGPFVAVNCAAIAESVAESELFGHVAGSFTGAKSEHPGLFRAASRGTLFLDEVGDMPLSLQPKLLRALEAREVLPVGASAPQPVDVRVIAATNVSLEEAIKAGRFRGDLFARIAHARVTVPPLRDRREDILTLVTRRLGAHARLSPDLVDALLTYEWPLNVRELFAIATELALHAVDGEVLELELVADRLSRAPASDSSPPEVERPVDVTHDELAKGLERCNGNVTALARAIGRSRTQTYRLLTQFGLDPSRSRPD